MTEAPSRYKLAILRALAICIFISPFFYSIIAITTYHFSNDDPYHPGYRAWWALFSKYTACFAILIFGYAVVAGARFWIWEKLWGLTAVLTLHKWMAGSTLVFAFLHMIFSMIGSDKASAILDILGWFFSVTDWPPIVLGRYVFLYFAVSSLLALTRMVGNRAGCTPRWIWKNIHYIFYPALGLVAFHGFRLSYNWLEQAISLYSAIFSAIAVLLRIATVIRNRISSVWRVHNLRWVGRGGQVALTELVYPSSDIPRRFTQRIPGQFVILSRELPGCGSIKKWSTPHPFTICCDPSNPHLQLIIRQTRGSFTTALASVQIGDKILVEGPYGLLSPDFANEDETLLIGGGVGFSPMMSIFRQACILQRTGRLRGRVQILYCATIFDDLISCFLDEMRSALDDDKTTPAPGPAPAEFRSPSDLIRVPLNASDDGIPWCRVAFAFSDPDELEKIRRDPTKLAQIPRASHDLLFTGNVSRPMLETLITRPKVCRVYLCGPGPMMKLVITTLREPPLNIPRTHIHFEAFVL